VLPQIKKSHEEDWRQGRTRRVKQINHKKGIPRCLLRGEAGENLGEKCRSPGGGRSLIERSAHPRQEEGKKGKPKRFGQKERMKGGNLLISQGILGQKGGQMESGIGRRRR